MGPIVVGWILAIFLAFSRTIASVLVSSIGGLILSGYLSWQHLSKSDNAACNIGEVFSCSAVNSSEYGLLSKHATFLPDIPLAFLGFAFYGGVLALALAVWNETSTEEEKEHPFPRFGMILCFIASMSLLVSGYLAYISGAKIGAWCLYCIGMYGCNAILFLCGVLWMARDENRAGDTSFQTFGISFAVLAVLGLLLSSTLNGEPVEGKWSIEVVNPKEKVFDGSEPIFGKRSAPYTLLEFADLQCSHCAKITPKIKTLVSQYAHVVNLQYKHFPLSNSCNHNISGPFHKMSCQAAYATECAGNQGKFWEMSAKIFDNSSYLEEKSFVSFAEQLRIDVTSFSACMKETRIKEGVIRDIQAADLFGLRGTPAFFLYDGQTWWKILDQDVGLEQTLILLSQGETPPGAEKQNPIPKEEPSSPTSK